VAANEMDVDKCESVFSSVYFGVVYSEHYAYYFLDGAYYLDI